VSARLSPNPDTKGNADHCVCQKDHFLSAPYDDTRNRALEPMFHVVETPCLIGQVRLRRLYSNPNYLCTAANYLRSFERYRKNTCYVALRRSIYKESSSDRLMFVLGSPDSRAS
jgi:hypothetical protein